MRQKQSKQAESLRRTVEQLTKQIPPEPARSLEELEALFWAEFVPKCRYPLKAPVEFRGKPIHLFPYQQRMIRMLFSPTDSIFCFGRQTGKTSVLGLWLSFMLFHQSGYQTAVTSFGEIQSKLLLDWVRLWTNSIVDERYSGNVAGSSAEHLLFRNGSSLIAFAHGRPLRGQSPNCLIVDEAQHTESEDMAAWAPTTVVTRPKIVLMGTMWAPNWWYDHVQNPQAFGYEGFMVKSTDATLPENGPISPAMLERHRKGLGDTGFFEQEYLLEVLATAGFAFAKDLVLKNVQLELEGQPPNGTVEVVGAWDSARSGQDQAAYLEYFLVNPARLVMVHQRTWNNTTVRQQVSYIANRQTLYVKYPFTVIVDATGPFGKTCVDELQGKGVSCYPFTISAQSRDQLVEKARIALDLGKVGIFGEPLKHQLLTYSQTVSKTGHVRFGRPGALDDLSNAFQLAAWYAYDKTRGFELEADDGPGVYFGEETRVSGNFRMGVEDVRLF